MQEITGIKRTCFVEKKKRKQVVIYHCLLLSTQHFHMQQQCYEHLDGMIL